MEKKRKGEGDQGEGICRNLWEEDSAMTEGDFGVRREQGSVCAVPWAWFKIWFFLVIRPICLCSHYRPSCHAHNMSFNPHVNAVYNYGDSLFHRG